LATVRIYKIAELLDTSSPEIVALLKRDHGSTSRARQHVEEMVARQSSSGWQEARDHASHRRHLRRGRRRQGQEGRRRQEGRAAASAAEAVAAAAAW